MSIPKINNPMDNILKTRLDLFNELPAEEIPKRSEIALIKASTNIQEVTILSKIISSIHSAGGNFIPVDLRYYKNVSFGDMIFSNIS